MTDLAHLRAVAEHADTTQRAKETAEALSAAARLMHEATSGFTLYDYALEGLEALSAAGWTITPPQEATQ